MSILIDANTRVCVQGISGLSGRTHIEAMLGFGTTVVAGVAPGHAGEKICGVPVFDSVLDAMEGSGEIDLSVCFAGGRYVRDALLEAAWAGVPVMVCMEEFVPVHDLLFVKRVVHDAGLRLIGPNTNGLASMGKASAGFFPMEFNRAGPIGVVSRSGTLCYGALAALQRCDLGQSTVVGVGGSQSRGTTFADCLKLFRDDVETELVVLLGEIGGSDEQAAAELVSDGYPKPVLALLAGRTAPPGVAMGHAGAVADNGSGSWQVKADALQGTGIGLAHTLDELAAMAIRALR